MLAVKLVPTLLVASSALQLSGHGVHRTITTRRNEPSLMASADLTDGAITLAPYFKLKDAEAFKQIWKADYAAFKNKDDCVHYAFCFTDDNTRAHCREAYTDAKAVLQHLANVDESLKSVLNPEVAELERLEVHGPKAEIDKLIEPLTPLGCVFYTAEWGFRTSHPAMEQDSVCHVYPYFSLKDEEAFKKMWKDAYPATVAAAAEEKSHQYAFSFSGNTASCRESYADADGFLKHLENVDAILKAVLDGPAELLRLEIHAPPSEVEKLKPVLAPLGGEFFNVEWGFRNAVP